MKKLILLRIFLWILFPVSMALLSFLLYKPHQSISLIPASDEGQYTLHTYSDSVKNVTNASSILWYQANDTVLAFRYKLGDGYAFPFAGLSLFARDSGYFDLSSYSYLHLNIKATEGKRLQLFMGVYTTGFTKPENEMTYRYLVKDLDLIKDQQNYSIPLTEFTTATWWYADNHVSEKDFKDVEYDKVKIFNIQNCQLIGKNIEDTLTIKKLTFTKNAPAFYGAVLVVSLLYYVTLIIVYYSTRKPHEQIHKVEINYIPIDADNQFEKELKKIIEFISSEYLDPELSLKKIQLSTGITESKISSLIKDTFNLGFKQYLNQLRLNEAKRLLMETNLPVSDIAYKVGYGNISHFNRVFKDSEGTSPNDFRKKK